MKLSTGREIIVDLDKITLAEWRELSAPEFKDQHKEDVIMAKVCGLSEDEFKALTLGDYKKVARLFVKAIQEPLADPS